MKINIISIGTFENSYFKEIFQNYTKRLKWEVFLKEINPKNANNFSKEQIKENEAKYILQALKPQQRIIVLDENGKQFKSREFAKKISDFALGGDSEINFIIGGAEGLSPEIIRKADLVISLGLMTMPHLMVRIVLIEQIYRAYTIINNHPYHRD